MSWITRIAIVLLLLSILLHPVLVTLAQAADIAQVLALGLFISRANAWTRGMKMRDVRAEITVENAGVIVRRRGYETVVRRSDITSACVFRRRLGTRVRPCVQVNVKGGGALVFDTKSREDAEEIVRELGFGKGLRPITIPLGRPPSGLVRGIIGVVAYVAGMFAGFAPSSMLSAVVQVATTVGVYAALHWLIRPPAIVVGDDGIVVRSGLRSRFTPGANIDSVSAGPPLRIHRKDGVSPIVIVSTPDPDAQQAAVEVVNSRFGNSEVSRTPRERFASMGRSASDWRRELRVSSQEGYRIAATTADDAFDVLEDPRATLEERAGAATALRAAGEPPERIRIAANAAVSDELRTMLEAIADAAPEDDAAFERVLERVLER